MNDIEVVCWVELDELLTRLREMALGEERDQVLGAVSEVVLVRTEKGAQFQEQPL
jgi:hypothetical protein